MLLPMIAHLPKRPRGNAGREVPILSVSDGLRALRLQRCTSAADCKAACSSKGVRVDKPEGERLAAFVREPPEFLSHCADPSRAFVALDALESPQLCQTEIVTSHGIGRDGLYRAATSGQAVAPADQAGSMCVFAPAAGRRAFQVASMAPGAHKWAHKPTPSWRFPLKLTRRGKGGRASNELGWIGPTQEERAHDPCSRRDPEGLPALQARAEEIDYFGAQCARSRDPA